MEETPTQALTLEMKIMGDTPPQALGVSGSGFVPRFIALFLQELPSIPVPGDRASKIDDFLSRLQEEMTKIDAFKRELPLTMILLRDAIEVLKEGAKRLSSSPVGEPVLAEFIPLSRRSEVNEGGPKKVHDQAETDLKDKKNWMSSVQLWNADNDQIPILEPQNKTHEGTTLTDGNVENGMAGPPREEDNTVQLGEVRSSSFHNSASVPPVKMVASCERPISSSSAAALPDSRRGGLQHELPRKQRRCWAPELHRLFVSALEKLGGPQVATPKQIKELMQVDGLTNDEVKSHLQKYRLHARRLLRTKDAPYPSGGKCRESSRAHGSQSGSSQGPLQLAKNKSRTSITEGYSIEEDGEGESQSCIA